MDESHAGGSPIGNPKREGRCTYTRLSRAVQHYATASGFYLGDAQEVIPVMGKFFNRFVNIGQGGVPLLLLERGE